MTYKNILVTGGAGFVGFHLIKDLLKDNISVIGIDNLNDYYNPVLKEKRLKLLEGKENYKFIKLDFSDYNELNEKLKDEKIDAIVHLGAQAGVRYSIENPFAYDASNSRGTLNIFEFARHNNINKVVFASSSSVYGGNKKIPFSEEDPVDKPVSFYAATKKHNEGTAHTYSHLYGIKTIGLRFFTVFGPWGRPDMAYFSFTKKISENQIIDVYNNGDHKRDFTYIDDVVQGIRGAIDLDAKYEIINLGNSTPIHLMDFIKAIEKNVGVSANLNMVPMQKGDVHVTYADISKAKRMIGYDPKTPFEEGIKKFVDWYKNNEGWLKEL